jgi:hypothetical protein
VISCPSAASSCALVTPTMPAPMMAMRTRSAFRAGERVLDRQ